MTDNFEKKVAVDGPVVNAGELGSSTFSPGQALPAGPLGLGRWLGTVEVVGNDVVFRGRDLYERCELGGATTMEAVEMERFMEMDCKDGPAAHPPSLMPNLMWGARV